jgi:hypothetical protein
VHVVNGEKGQHGFFVGRFEFTEQFAFEGIGHEPDALHGFIPLQFHDERLQRLSRQARNGVLADVARHSQCYRQRRDATQRFSARNVSRLASRKARE